MRRARGFTLVELIVVIVLVGVIGGVVITVFKPALEGYLDVGRRADLTNQADTALRRMVTEVRGAVPNSLRSTGDQCLELVPTADGGRLRTAPDTTWDSVATRPRSEAVDGSGALTVFDVLTPLGPGTEPGDLVVVANQDPSEVYGQSNVGTIRSVAPAPSDGTLAPGIARITLTAPVQFPPGAESGRFVVVPGNERAVTYRCENVGNTNGTGSGILYRYRNYGFSQAQNCQPPATERQILATKVSGCSIRYQANPGITQQSGFVQVQLTLTEAGESVNLIYSAHVNNVP